MPGSEYLTFRHLLREPDLAMPTYIDSVGGTLSGQARELLELLKGRTDVAGRYLFIAPPGMGKSTLAALLWCTLIDERIADPSLPLPFLIDLRSYRGINLDAEFGTERHMATEVRSLINFDGNKASSALNWNPGLPNPHAFLILDSLDELMSGRPQSEVISLVDRPLLRAADVVLSRIQFYEQYLQDTEFAREREVLRLQPWPQANIKQYVHAYYRVRSGKDGGAPAEALLARLDSAPALRQIVSVPIRLNMVIDLYGTTGAVDEIPKRPSLLRVYEAFIRRALRVDAANRGTTISTDDKYELLELLAWRFYEDGAFGHHKAPAFSEREVNSVIRELHPTLEESLQERVRNELIDSGLLVSIRSGLVGRSTIDFSHKSFQEFLVASRAQIAMCESPELSVEVFSRNLTPEVSEFLKEALDEINSFSRYQRAAVRTVIEAIASLGGPDEQHTKGEVVAPSPRHSLEDVAVRRLAREQLCYYLGNLESQDAKRYLLELLKTEKDDWIRRGIIVGLAFGGEIGPLNQYVTSLAEERATGGPAPQNSTNIGHQLSWFGDQSFNAMAPDADEGEPDCSKTVARLIYQMRTTTNQPNWRIDLYTILDLWRYRPVSERSFMETALTLRAELTGILVAFRGDAVASQWPETPILAELVDHLSNSTPS